MKVLVLFAHFVYFVQGMRVNVGIKMDVPDWSKKGSSANFHTNATDPLERLQEKAAKTTIVVYKQGLGMNAMDRLEARIKSTCKCSVQHLNHIGALILRYPTSERMKSSELSRIYGVEYAFDDTVFEVDIGENVERKACSSKQTRKSSNNNMPNDELFSTLWALQKQPSGSDINWQEGIDKYLADPVGGDPDGPTVTVAVVDTGVDYNHPDLRDAMWVNPGEIADNDIDDDGNGCIDDVHGCDFIDDDGNPEPEPVPGSCENNDDPYCETGHGTHCAGTIAATMNNKIGITGVGNPTNKLKIMAIRVIKSVMRKDGKTVSHTSTCAIFRALNYVVQMEVPISSNSYVGTLDQNVLPHIPEWFRDDKRLFERFLSNNSKHLLISAAGNGRVKNGNWTCEGFEITDDEPALYPVVEAPNHISVGASDINDEKGPFSNWGIPFVHVMAPGVEICSTNPVNSTTGDYVSKNGTSMATPHVAGLAALIVSMSPPGMMPSDVKGIIEQTVQKKHSYEGKVTSGGLIDVGKAVELAARYRQFYET